jgi:hypothetical protein
LDLWSAAELISRLFFPISPRTLPTWPVGWKQINGRRHCPTSDLLAEAARRIESPPSKRGAHLRRPKAATTAAVVAAVAE